MNDVQTGHEHERPRASVLELSSTLVDGLDPARRDQLVATLVELSRSTGDETDLADQLEAAMSRLDVPQPRPVVERLVENLRGAQELTIVTDRGQVLAGDPSFRVSRQDPGVESTEDPEHGDRPLYS